MRPEEKKRYLREIKADYNYFKSSYERADVQISIENIPLNDIAELIIAKLGKIKTAENT